MNNNSQKVTIEENYCETTDKTFIMEYVSDDTNLLSSECIGWYCGEPNADDTARYSNREMKAIYDM